MGSQERNAPHCKATTEKERRDQALRILKEQLQAPIILTVPSCDIYSYGEFQRIEDVVERCLEPMCIKGISLVPEIGGDGRELYVHVSQDGEREAGVW
jgi:hypothetical protein